MKLKYILIMFIINFSFLYGAEEIEIKNKVHKNLRCLVCQGQSIADSNSDFAQTIKLVVEDLIKEGKTEDQIYSFMADKYGEWIVFKPQVNQYNFALWLVPYLALLFGGLFILFTFKKKRKNS